MTHVTRLPALVSLNQVGLQFANGETLFDSLTLGFDHGPTGIVGRNGMGKSLLAQLIAGQLAPSFGTITRFADVAYVAQDHFVLNGQTVAQAAGVAEALDALQRLVSGTASAEDLERVDGRWDLAERLRTLLDEAGLPDLDPQQPTARLSGGQLARVALVGAFLASAALLVLDEPTNHLDQQGRAWLLNRLEKWRGGLIVVSHDRQLLSRMQRIVELTALGPRVYGGNYQAYRAQRQTEQNAAQAALEHARSERTRERKRQQREHDTLQRRAAASGKNADTANVSRFERADMKGAATQIMGHVRQAHQTRKTELDAQVRDAHGRVLAHRPTLVSLPGTAVPANRQVFTLVDAQLPWLPPDEPTSYVSCSAIGPMRIALIGPNGCGKSTLLKMLAGDPAWTPRSGICATHVPCAYLDQRLELIDDERSIVEQLGLLDSPLTEAELRGRLALLQLDASRVVQPSGQLSGGERLKAAIAVALWKAPAAQLLLLDEPTNHLDLESVQAFERALRDFPGTLVVASHDADFLAALEPTHCLKWEAARWCFQRLHE
ncbi:ABC-F family ATP-binding cassette domain-containing protein [Pseudomonas fluorescens]|uniref:Putative ABC transporter ATP-binding protein YheS n=1 Tax=Pseudomonas fluorescens TaxID=294 RepID=A0A5E7EA42_PSEFL|nr:ABC-F family ATP-binding cassette domain-containing protein [Pseudomonas fluorescens]VVO23645.1 putative ABC transporter ATP-binding protein YheS [Pseudomonas fluorescens]